MKLTSIFFTASAKIFELQLKDTKSEREISNLNERKKEMFNYSLLSEEEIQHTVRLLQYLLQRVKF